MALFLWQRGLCMSEKQKSVNFHLISSFSRWYQGKLYGKCICSSFSVTKQWRYLGLSRGWCAMWNWASNTSKSEVLNNWFKASKWYDRI